MTVTLLQGRLLIKTGDITLEPVDCIVNAANSSLLGGGGVDGAIHHKGGPEIVAACRNIREKQYPDGLLTGQAVSTPAGNLPSTNVIHTVGPVWKGGTEGEPELLAACYANSLQCAADLNAATVAFPAISTGVYGYPRELAAVTAYEAIKEALKKYSAITVILVFFIPEDQDIFLSSISQ